MIEACLLYLFVFVVFTTLIAINWWTYRLEMARLDMWRELSALRRFQTRMYLRSLAESLERSLEEADDDLEECVSWRKEGF